MQQPTLQCIATYAFAGQTRIITSSCTNLTVPGIQEDLDRLNVKAVISLHKLPSKLQAKTPRKFIALREKDYWHPKVFKAIQDLFQTHCKDGAILIHCKAGRTRSMLTAYALAAASTDHLTIEKYGTEVTAATKARFNRYINHYNRIPANIVDLLKARVVQT